MLVTVLMLSIHCASLSTVVYASAPAVASAPLVAALGALVDAASAGPATPDAGRALLDPDASQLEDPDLARGGRGPASDTGFGDTRGYLGVSVAGGIGTGITFGSRDASGAELQFALRGGVWIHHFNLDLEVAPGTDVGFVRSVLVGPGAPKTPVASGLVRVSVAGVATLPSDGGDSVDHPGEEVSVGWLFRLWAGIAWPGFDEPWGGNALGTIVPTPAPSFQFSLLGVVVRTHRLQFELNALCPFLTFTRGAWLGLTLANVSAVWLF